MKCQEFDPEQKLSVREYPDLAKLLSSLDTYGTFDLNMLRSERRDQPEGTYPEILPITHLVTNLIEMAARLGDDAAGLTRRGAPYGDDGISLGRFRGLLTSPFWQHLSTKNEPSQEHLLDTFRSLSKHVPDDVKFNWDWLVRRLCEPPFDQSHIPNSHSDTEEREDSTDPQSCRDVINELYIDGDLTDSELDLIDQFERTALKLDLYH